VGLTARGIQEAREGCVRASEQTDSVLFAGVDAAAGENEASAVRHEAHRAGSHVDGRRRGRGGPTRREGDDHRHGDDAENRPDQRKAHIGGCNAKSVFPHLD
jgi:hypothetical protein